jgi:hypothetical protein
MRRSSLVGCIALLLFLLALAAPVASGNAAGSEVSAPSTPVVAAAAVPEFIATNEWQVVLPGQSVPPGLWVRMDMTTGQKTARLLPEEEHNDAVRKRDAAAVDGSLTDGVHSIVQQQKEPESGLVLVPDEDQSSNRGPLIRELTAPGSEVACDSEPLQGNEPSLLAARGARLASLKSNFYLKEDVEMMKQLLAICVDGDSSVTAVRQALEVLEEMVHQVDNANDFATIGGMDVVVIILQQDPTVVATTEQETPSGSIAKEFGVDEAQATNMAANATHSPSTADVAPPADVQLLRLYQLQSSAVWVLGTAAQNNRQVQDRARTDGAIPNLTKLLQNTIRASTHEAEPRQTFQLRSARLKLAAKLIYALSALLRNNARSQDAFDAVWGALTLQFAWRDAPTGIRCDTAEAGTRPPLVCLTVAEERALLALRSTLSQKAMALVHNLLADRLVTAHEATQRPARKAKSAAALAAAAVPAEKGEPAAPTAADQTAAEEASAASSSSGVGSNARVVPSPDLLHSDLSSASLFATFTSSPEWALHVLREAAWPLRHVGVRASPYDAPFSFSVPLIDWTAFRLPRPDCDEDGSGGSDSGSDNTGCQMPPDWNLQAFKARKRAIDILLQLLSGEGEQQQQQQSPAQTQTQTPSAVRAALRPHAAALIELQQQSAEWIEATKSATMLDSSEEEITEQQQTQVEQLQQILSKLI